MTSELDVKDSALAAAKYLIDIGPNVAREMLTWDIASNGALSVLFALLAIGCAVWAYRLFRKDFELAPVAAMLSLGAVLLGIAACCATHDTLHAIVAPRAYLLEKALHK